MMIDTRKPICNTAMLQTIFPSRPSADQLRVGVNLAVDVIDIAPTIRCCAKRN